MLLLDRLILVPDSERHTQIEPGMKVAGIKNVTANEPFLGTFSSKSYYARGFNSRSAGQCACAGGLILEDNKGSLDCLPV